MGRVRYTVTVGPGVAPSPAEFGSKVAAVLGDSRGWRRYGYEFVRTPRPGPGVLNIRLETSSNADAMCGATGFSCWRPRPEDIVVHEGNWMGGSKSELDIDRYRTYVVNHEVGHALGLAHQQCPAAECARRGLAECPASIMQQMTRGPAAIAPCVESEWPLGPGWRVDDPRRETSRALLYALVSALVSALVCLAIVAVVLSLARLAWPRNRLRADTFERTLGLTYAAETQ